MTFKFGNSSRSRSASPKSKETEFPPEVLGATSDPPPPLPSVPPPLLTDPLPPVPPPLQAEPPPPANTDTFIFSQQPFTSFGVHSFPETNVIIRNNDNQHIYDADKGKRLDVDNKTVAATVTNKTDYNALGARPKENVEKVIKDKDDAVYEQLQNELPSIQETLKNIEEEIQNLKSKDNKMNSKLDTIKSIAIKTGAKVKEHNEAIVNLNEELTEQDDELEQIAKDIGDLKSTSSRSSSRRSSRAGTRLPSRAGSRLPSRDASPTSEVLQRTSDQLERDLQHLHSELERAEDISERKEKKNNHTYNDIGDIITHKAIWNSLPALTEEQQERYPMWLATFVNDFKTFKLPPHLMVQAAIQKLPITLKTTIMNQPIHTRDDLEDFLRQQIFAGRVYSYQKEMYMRDNKMSESDRDFPTLLRRIRTDQVPTLIALQTELRGASTETLQIISKREELELFSEAIPATTHAIALNKGMSSTIEALFKSCNESESAKLRLSGNQTQQEDTKKIAAIEVQANGIDVSTPGDTQPTEAEPRSKEDLQKEIKRLKSTIANLRKKKGNKKYCYYHKSTNHDAKECTKLQGIPENTVPKQQSQRKFIFTEDGSKNMCGYCAAHRLKLPTANCRHCWRHSNPGKAVPNNDCGSCKFNRRVRDRPDQPPPGSNPPHPQRPPPPVQAQATQQNSQN